MTEEKTSDSSFESETLNSLLENDKLQAVFVGGKGGVGKTTCSCSLAIQFAKRRKNEKILLISTDPAHNVSDAFLQQFSGEPEQVKGLDHLYACEIDPSLSLEKDIESIKESAGENETSEEMQKFLGEFRAWVMSVPGIDEAMALSSVLSHVENGEYGLLIFDTAPTGHTIRLLQLPTVLKVGLEKLQSWKSRLSSLFATVSSLIYKDSGSAAQARAMRTLEEKLEVYHTAVTKIANIFKDNERTEFVCVANATFLSVYETRRLIAELRVSKIACRNVIVNMLMPRAFSRVKPEDGGANVIYDALRNQCNFNETVAAAVKDAVELCGGISRIQENYLKTLRDGISFDDANPIKITMLPLLPGEVRGLENLTSFSERLCSLDPKLSFTNRIDRLTYSPLDDISSRKDYEANIKAKFMNRTAASDEEENKEEMEIDEEVIEKITVGDFVEVHGLKKAIRHNGKRGEVRSMKNGRFEVRIKSENSPLLIKEENLRIIEKMEEKQASTTVPQSVTPEMISLVQKTLMKPDGLKSLLEHELVKEMKDGDDNQMKEFFNDIESNGAFAALKYLSNQHVMSKLANVATELEREGW